MLKVLSTTWPWNQTGFNLTVEQVIEHLLALGTDEVCIRTPAYYTPYATDYHLRLADQARAKGMTVSLWPVISLYYPEQQAQAIKGEVERFGPSRLFLDAEGGWVKGYIGNLPRFLDGIVPITIPIGLGSYRRADLHNLNWTAWLKHQVGGKYTIAFQAPQMYPIGSTTPAGWVADFKASVDSHSAFEAAAGRQNIPWIPWMPAFIGAGYEGQTVPWIPSASCYQAGTEYLVSRLGHRLQGFNHWSLDKQLIDTRMKGVYDYIASYGASAPLFLNLPEEVRWVIVRDDLLKRGVIIQ